MKKVLGSIFLLCGVVLSIAAVPVFGQSDDVGINRKPLKDLFAQVKANNIDWKEPFAVDVETVLTKDGKFDRKKTKFTKTEGDAETIEAVKQAFGAVGESGWMNYLRNQGIENIRISARQTAENFSVSLVSAQPTPERAKTVSSGLSGNIQTALLLDKNGIRKLGDDEKKLLTGTRVTTDEKTVTMNVSLAAKDFQDMINRRLNEEKEVNG